MYKLITCWGIAACSVSVHVRWVALMRVKHYDFRHVNCAIAKKAGVDFV